MPVEDRLNNLLLLWEEYLDEGKELAAADLCRDSPELEPELAKRICALRRMNAMLRMPGETAVGPVPVPLSEAATKNDQPEVGAGGPDERSHGAKNFLLVIPGYEVLKEVGRGGMGVVYKARQVHLNRLVALKMILHGDHAGPEDRIRFLAEAEAIASVRHPGIVQVYEFGTHEGLPYFALEFCPGGSLADKLEGAPLAPREAARALELIARAMHAAHQVGVLHRDLKPANVLLDETGAPRVTDFGLARRVDGGRGLTQTGAVMGTPSYMAPEQAQGDKSVGILADVYALGAILYECLTGRPPFRAATTFETLRQVIHQEPVAPRQLNPGVQPDLETITLKCLHKEPSRRYASAQELAEDLRSFLAGEPIAARPVGPLERTVKWYRCRPALAAMAGVVVAVTVLGFALVGWQWQRAVTALAREQQARTERSLAQIDALLSAHPQAAPGILESLEQVRGDVLPRLREVWAEPDRPQNRPRRIRAALALLPVEPAAIKEKLVEWMLQVEDPAELLLIRDQLRPYASELRSTLWARAEAETAVPAVRLRLLAALAAFDPDSTRWQKVGALAVEPLLSADPLHLGAWATALRPVRGALLEPLGEVFRGRRLAERRQAAASVLADYAADRPAVLASLLTEADEQQFPAILAKLRVHKSAATLLYRELAQAAARGGPEVDETERIARAGRQANAAVAQLRLGSPQPLWPLLRHSPYPDQRSWLVQRLAPLGVEPEVLVRRLEKEKDVSARRALILALGEYSTEQFPADLRSRVVPQLLAWYLEDPDPGIHGVVDWLLRHRMEGPEPRRLDWGQAAALLRIDKKLAARREASLPIAVTHAVGLLALPRNVLTAGWSPDFTGQATPEPRRWYVNRQGQTLVTVPGPVEFLMGSPDHEVGREDKERLHRRRIGRGFAIAAKPVTVAQFRNFLRAHPEVKHVATKMESQDEEGPVLSITWYEAAQYCRWLSEQERLPEYQMCYPSVVEIEKCKGGGALSLPAAYLSRTGYRLPTEAEWEYACRAGARTRRYCGSSDRLLQRYAWSVHNAQGRTWPVGQKRPNDLGLFDMHGHVWQWCQDGYASYKAGEGGRAADDIEDNRAITSKSVLVLRGGSFYYLPSLVRCAYRLIDQPVRGHFTYGLRVARTHR